MDCLIILIWWEPVGLAVFSDYSWPAFSPSTDSCKLSNCSINYHSSCSSQQTGNHLCSFLADVFIQSQGSCLLSFKRLAKQCLFPGGPPLNSLLILKRVYASKSLRWSLSCLSPSRLQRWHLIVHSYSTHTRHMKMSVIYIKCCHILWYKGFQKTLLCTFDFLLEDCWCRALMCNVCKTRIQLYGLWQVEEFQDEISSWVANSSPSAYSISNENWFIFMSRHSEAEMAK